MGPAEEQGQLMPRTAGPDPGQHQGVQCQQPSTPGNAVGQLNQGLCFSEKSQLFLLGTAVTRDPSEARSHETETSLGSFLRESSCDLSHCPGGLA